MADQTWEGGTDPRLLLLLSSVFGTGPYATLELTVVVDGCVMSGSAVSEHAWTQRQNDQVRIGSPDIADALDSLEAAADESGSRTEGPDRFIHFLGPDLLTGGTRIPLQATRVDLRKVAAWSIGRVPGD